MHRPSDPPCQDCASVGPALTDLSGVFFSDLGEGLHKRHLSPLPASHGDRNEIRQALPGAAQSVLSSVCGIKGSRMYHLSCPTG